MYLFFESNILNKIS